MGTFSWKFADAQREALVIGGEGFLVTPNAFILEPFYDGYGHFGSDDVYELVVHWNRRYIKDNPEQVTYHGTTYKDFFWYPVVTDLSIPGDRIVEECKERGLVPKERESNFELRHIGIDIACWDSDNEALAWPIKVLKTLPMTHDQMESLPASKNDEEQGRGPSQFFEYPQRVIFLNEREDFIHGGVAFEDKVLDLSDGETYIIGDEVEVKEELPWKNIEKAAVGEEMSYWA